MDQTGDTIDLELCSGPETQEKFPYTLLWSKPGMPQFICIEPWHSLPSPEGGSIKWEEKAAAAVLASGEAWSTTLSTSFVR